MKSEGLYRFSDGAGEPTAAQRTDMLAAAAKALAASAKVMNA